MQNTTRKILPFGLAALLCCLVLAAPAQAAKRVALIIGNNAYENVPALQKAVNDSEAISQELAKLGFDVVSAENVGRRAMSRAQRDALIAKQAYRYAEARGFVGGDPAADWRRAEEEIDGAVAGETAPVPAGQ